MYGMGMCLVCLCVCVCVPGYAFGAFWECVLCAGVFGYVSCRCVVGPSSMWGELVVSSRQFFCMEALSD